MLGLGGSACRMPGRRGLRGRGCVLSGGLGLGGL